MTAARESPDISGVDAVRGGGASAEDRARCDTYDHLVPVLAEFGGTAPGDPRRRVLRDELAIAFWPVVVDIARRYRNRGEPTEDLEQVVDW